MEGGAWWAAIHRVSKSDMTEQLHLHFSLSCIGEGNGNPLQCSCLEYPRNGGAWWAAVYGVAQSWTRLKRLSSSSKHMEEFSFHQNILYSFYFFFFSQAVPGRSPSRVPVEMTAGAATPACVLSGKLPRNKA